MMKKEKLILIKITCVMMIILFLFSCSKEDKVVEPLFLYAYFNSDKTSIAPGDMVQYKDLSMGNPTQWNWTFEGGTPSSSTEKNPSVVYETLGSYPVSLVVSDGVNSYTKLIKNYMTVVQPDVVEDHLIAYFPFDGSSEDIGPSNVTVNHIGNLTFDGTDRHSIPNSAAVFDGTSGIVIPDNSTFNFGTSDFTISCWIKTSEIKQMMIWQESGADGSKDNQTWLRIGDNTTDRQIRFDVEDGGGSSIINYGGGPNLISDGIWHHIVCVREGGTTRLYIDGEKKAEMVKTVIKNVSNSQDFKIGVQEKGGGHTAYFEGLLDDFKVYDKALNDITIAGLYQE